MQEEPWLSVNSQGKLLVLVYSDWPTFLSIDSNLQIQGWRMEKDSHPHLDGLELQELGCLRDLACGGQQKSQPAVEWTVLKQRHNPDTHGGPHREMAELCMAWHTLWMSEFVATKFH